MSDPITNDTQAAPSDDPWAAANTPPASGADSADGGWLATPAPSADAADAPGTGIAALFDGSLPIEAWINQGLSWMASIISSMS